MERYKPIFQKKNWITVKLSEIEHVKEIQAISYIWNHLKRQNALSGTAQEHKKEADTKIVIQKIIGLLSSGHTVKQIANILREDLFFVQLISTIYQREFQLYENLRLSDLTKNMGLSDFSKPFAKDRQKKKGAGNISAKLVEMRVNRNLGYITFIFLQEPTDLFNSKVTKPPSMKLVPSNLYTQQVRILDFFKLLKTNPEFKNFKELTIDDIKEVIKNADIKCHCDCPAQYWQGNTYNLSVLDGSTYTTDIAPKHWDKYHGEGNQILCKHLQLLFNGISFWISPMASMIYKYLQNK